MSNTTKSGIELIAKERDEQIKKHGYTTLKDAAHNANEQLSLAAGWLCYNEQGCADMEEVSEEQCPQGWNEMLWAKMCAKPYKERLIIAGALIAAEIDRLNTLSISTNEP